MCDVVPWAAGIAAAAIVTVTLGTFWALAWVARKDLDEGRQV